MLCSALCSGAPSFRLVLPEKRAGVGAIYRMSEEVRYEDATARIWTFSAFAILFARFRLIPRMCKVSGDYCRKSTHHRRPSLNQEFASKAFPMPLRCQQN